MVTFGDDDDDELRWTEESFADVQEKIRGRLEELAAGDLKTFMAALLPLVTATTAAAADVAALVAWRHGDPREGDGQAEIGDAVETVAAVLRWAAWLVGDEIEE